MPNPLFTRTYRIIRQNAIVTFVTFLIGFAHRGMLAHSGIWKLPAIADEVMNLLKYPFGAAAFLLWLWLMPDVLEARRRRYGRMKGDLTEPAEYETFDELWPRIPIWKPILIGVCILAAIEVKFWIAGMSN